jgi:MshEN domain
MSLKLGEMLVKEGSITRKQLEEALKCQDIFGGRLGTNLVEMGFIDEQKLVDCLSRQLEAPYVTADQLMSIPPEVINLISVDLAREYKVVPVNLDKKKLSVAIWDPSDLSALDAISFITGFIIKPLVCSELRLLMALEQYYGIKREVRYIQLKGGTGSRTREEDRTTQQGAPVESEATDESPFKDLMDELPPPLPAGTEESHETWDEFAGILQKTPGKDPLLGQSPDAAQQAGLDLERSSTPPPQPQPSAVVPPPPAVEAGPPPALPPVTLVATLAAAPDRDAIADALVTHLGREFTRVALFMIKGRIATGWRGVLDGAPIAGFDHFQVPLDDPTLLKPVVDAKNFYLGPVLDTADNARVITGLGGGVPDMVLLMPIIMMGRVVSVFYVDGDKALLGRKLFDLQKVIGKAALAFEILILKNKILLT